MEDNFFLFLIEEDLFWQNFFSRNMYESVFGILKNIEKSYLERNACGCMDQMRKSWSAIIRDHLDRWKIKNAQWGDRYRCKDVGFYFLLPRRGSFVFGGRNCFRDFEENVFRMLQSIWAIFLHLISACVYMWMYESDAHNLNRYDSRVPWPME